MCLGNFSKGDSQMSNIDLEDNQEINVKVWIFFPMGKFYFYF